MAIVKPKATLLLLTGIELTELEIVALNDLLSYGVDKVLDHLAKLGEYADRPGLRPVFNCLHNELPGILQRCDLAHVAFNTNPVPPDKAQG